MILFELHTANLHVGTAKEKDGKGERSTALTDVFALATILIRISATAIDPPPFAC